LHRCDEGRANQSVARATAHPSYDQSFDYMPDVPEARARQNIDQLLTAAGWIVCSFLDK